MRYEVVFGFNTKQWWAYDNKTDEYCDPPIEVLNKIKNHSNDINQQQEFFKKILEEEPNWLLNLNYRYSDIDI